MKELLLTNLTHLHPIEERHVFIRDWCEKVRANAARNIVSEHVELRRSKSYIDGTKLKESHFISLTYRDDE